MRHPLQSFSKEKMKGELKKKKTVKKIQSNFIRNSFKRCEMQGRVKERGNWKVHSSGGDARTCVGNELASRDVRSTWRRNISMINFNKFSH